MNENIWLKQMVIIHFFNRSYQHEIHVLSFITIKGFVLLNSCLFIHAMQLLMSVYHCDLVLFIMWQLEVCSPWALQRSNEVFLVI